MSPNEKNIDPAELEKLVDIPAIKEAVRNILVAVGEDPDRPERSKPHCWAVK